MRDRRWPHTHPAIGKVADVFKALYVPYHFMQLIKMAFYKKTNRIAPLMLVNLRYRGALHCISPAPH
jgi:hypothetical protein